MNCKVVQLFLSVFSKSFDFKLTLWINGIKVKIFLHIVF